MIAEARHVMPEAWWLAVTPGLALIAVISSLAAISDGLQAVAERSVASPPRATKSATV
jgi:ABC-type dipeptide/oligopeptide/nickel transport system permease subunit